MSDDTKSSQPNPVMLVDQQTVDFLKTAAQWSWVSVDGTAMSSMALISAYVKKKSSGIKYTVTKADEQTGFVTGAEIMTMFGSLKDNRICTVVIVNTLNSSLTLTGNTYHDGDHHGIQTLHPATAETAGKGGKLSYRSPNVIPGKTSIDGDEPRFGVGIYRFEKDLSAGIGFYGTSGALQFRAKDEGLADGIAIGFNVGQGSDDTLAVTTKPSSFGRLSTFYDQQIDDVKTPMLGASGKGKANIVASLGAVDLNGSDSDRKHNAVVTAFVSYEDNSEFLEPVLKNVAEGAAELLGDFIQSFKSKSGK